ncbi:hypothetical protein SEA_ROBINROSE_59 [Microbacterium phage RobinRose]|nr:hypothetical protein SEA_ROBINROSE_59 [Microbacterium phage RobinRose]
MSENIGTQIRRDTVLEQRMLEAVIAERNAQPRNQQVQIGPSEIGGCRELLRAGLFEPETMSEPETHWATAAHVGSIMGDDLEQIFGKRMDAETQRRVTAHFNQLGVDISGAIDLLFIELGQVSDLKSTNDMGGVLYDLKKNASAIETLLSIWREGLLFQKKIETADGGYELTDKMISTISKLHYYVQLSIYVSGAIQEGILDDDAEARLVFYDRGGAYQEFVALVVTNEELRMFYEIGQMRLAQVVHAQEGYEKSGGQQVVIGHLRDMTPSYCFSPKVMCPRRQHCWGGSDWTADNRISAEHAKTVERYIAGREMAKLGEGMKKAAREELKGIEGVLPDGRMVTWVRGGSQINVVETTATETPRTIDSTLDEALEKLHHEATRERTPEEQVEDRTKSLKAMRKPELLLVAQAFDADAKGTIPVLIEMILDQEFPWRTGVTEEQVAEAHEKSVAEELVEPDEGAYLRPDEVEAQANLDGVTLEQTMITIGDMTYRCECGTNVFTKIGEHEYTCNGCGTRYDDGETNDPEVEVEAEVVATVEETPELHAEHTERAVEHQEADDAAVEAEAERARADFVQQQEQTSGLGRVVFRPTEAELAAEEKQYDPNRPGLILLGNPGLDKMRASQYDSDAEWRANLTKGM